MRVIAAEAGVSVGNAYYYFSSKEQLIQAYYDQAQSEHEAACAGLLATERAFGCGCAGCCVRGSRCPSRTTSSR